MVVAVFTASHAPLVAVLIASKPEDTLDCSPVTTEATCVCIPVQTEDAVVLTDSNADEVADCTVLQPEETFPPTSDTTVPMEDFAASHAVEVADFTDSHAVDVADLIDS